MINNSSKEISSDIIKVIRKFTKKKNVPLHDCTIIDLSQVKKKFIIYTSFYFKF